MRRVLAVHQFEYAVASALHGQVYVAANVGLFGYYAQRVVAHVLGVRRGKAHSHARHGARHHAQQHGERNLALCSVCVIAGKVTVGVYVLPKERYFLVSVACEVAHFGQDTLRRARTLAPPYVRHNAVVAKVVAPARNAYEARNMVSAHALGYDIGVCFGRGKLYVYSLLPVLGFGDELRQHEIRIRPGHEVGVVVVEQILLGAFGHAAEHADNKPSLAAAAQGVERFEPVVDFLLGVLAHGTGVEEHGVGIGNVSAHVVIGRLHYGGDHLAVGHVHLAAVCLDIKFLCHNM